MTSQIDAARTALPIFARSSPPVDVRDAGASPAFTPVQAPPGAPNVLVVLP